MEFHKPKFKKRTYGGPRNDRSSGYTGSRNDRGSGYRGPRDDRSSGQDIVVKEMIEVQDTIEILEVGALDLTEMIEVLDLIEVLKIIDAEKHSKQLVVIVETNVKYHSNQNMTDLFIAKNVSKITNHKNVAVALDSIEEQAIVEMSEAQDTIKVNLDSKETVLQFTVEIILEQQNIRQIVMNPMEKIIGNTILIILIHFILQ
jgi:hypothetical protein